MSSQLLSFSTLARIFTVCLITLAASAGAASAQNRGSASDGQPLVESGSDGQPLVETARVPGGAHYGHITVRARLMSGGICGEDTPPDDDAAEASDGGFVFGQTVYVEVRTSAGGCDALAECGIETIDTDGDGLCDAVNLCTLDADGGVEGLCGNFDGR